MTIKEGEDYVRYACCRIYEAGADTRHTIGLSREEVEEQFSATCGTLVQQIIAMGKALGAMEFFDRREESKTK